MQPFVERDIRFEGVRRGPAWSLKLYSVRWSADELDRTAFDEALDLALATLPAPDPTRGRPGLGFFIAHQGRTGDYGVLGWWNHENELPISIQIRRDRSEPWRAAGPGESFCVWDLEVLWAERGAWIETMLAPGGSDPEAYLAAVPEAFAGG